MAKIADLVKTYRILSDPNAPDWNVKFLGTIAVAAVVVAGGAGALLWAVSHDPAQGTPAAVAQEPSEPAPPQECALAPDAPRPPTLATGCPAPEGVLP